MQWAVMFNGVVPIQEVVRLFRSAFAIRESIFNLSGNDRFLFRQSRVFENLGSHLESQTGQTHLHGRRKLRDRHLQATADIRILREIGWHGFTQL